MKSKPLAEFSIPSLPLSWTAVALKVQASMVTLFINCQEVQTIVVARPQTVKFDPASSLFIGQVKSETLDSLVS